MRSYLQDNNHFRLVWLIILVSALLMTVFPIQSEDVFMYLALGRHFFESGYFPTSDPFLVSSHDLNFHIMHEWGSYLLFYSLYFIGGIAGVILLKSAIIAGIFAVPTCKALARQKGDLLLVVALLLTIIAASHRFIERASLFSDLFTVCTIAILLKSDLRSSRLHWILPVIFLVWVNLHPGFHPALILTGFFSAQFLIREPGRERVIALALLLACIAATLCNPLGLAGFTYPLRTVLDDRWNIFRESNYEWISTLNPIFLKTWEAKALIALILLTLPSAWSEFKDRKWFSLSIWVVSIGLGLSASRFMSTSAYSLLTWLTFAQKSSPLNLPWSRKTSIPIFFLSTALLISISVWGYKGAAGLRQIGLGIDSRFFPVQAAHYIPEDGQNVFNEFGWGSYLAWLWNGRHKIFYHGHIDDPTYFLDHYLGVGRSLPQFQKTIQESKIEYFLLNPKKLRTYPPPKLWEYLNSPPWKMIFEDDTAIVFKKEIQSR